MLAGAGQHLNLRAHPLDPGGADEDRVDGAVEAGEVDVALERIDLAAECVPAHRHVDGTQRRGLAAGFTRVEDLPGQQNHAGAGSVGGHAGGQSLPQWFEQIELAQQQADGGGLPAGDHQRVDGVEFVTTTHRGRLRSGFAQGRQVFAGVALQCQHADARAAHLPGGL